MSDTIETLHAALAAITEPEEMKIASAECKNFLNRARIQSYTEEAAGQALFEAVSVRDRKELNALAEYSKFPIVREGAKNMADQLAAKAAPVPVWPTL